MFRTAQREARVEHGYSLAGPSERSPLSLSASGTLMDASGNISKQQTACTELEANAAHVYEQRVTPSQLAKPGLYKQLHSSRRGAIFLHYAKGRAFKMGVEPTEPILVPFSNKPRCLLCPQPILEAEPCT